MILQRQPLSDPITGNAGSRRCGSREFDIDGPFTGLDDLGGEPLGLLGKIGNDLAQGLADVAGNGNAVDFGKTLVDSLKSQVQIQDTEADAG